MGLRPLLLPPLVVGMVNVQEHVPAGYPSLQFGADEEGARHLSVEGVRLLGGWREAVAQHDGDEVLNALGGALGAEVEGFAGRKGFAEDHHSLHVGIHERLVASREKCQSAHNK